METREFTLKLGSGLLVVDVRFAVNRTIEIGEITARWNGPAVVLDARPMLGPPLAALNA